ncbi:MAG: GAF domain-containing protein [Desulfovibrio sp.]
MTIRYESLKDIPELLIPYMDQMSQFLSQSYLNNLGHWYGLLEPGEVERVAMSSLELIFSCLRDNSLQSLKQHLDHCGPMKLEKGVGISDFVKNLLLSKEVIRNKIYELSDNIDHYHVWAEALDQFYIDAVALQTEQYSCLLSSRLKAQHDRTTLLLDVSRTVTSDLEPNTVLERLAQTLAEVIDDGCCTIFLVDPENGNLSPRAGWGYNSEQCMLSVTGLRMCSAGDDLQVYKNSYGVCSTNPESSSFADMLPEAVRSGWLKNFPITNGETVVGVAVLSSSAKGFVFDDENSSLVEGILNAVAVTIESAASAQRTERRLQESEALRRVANRLLKNPEREADDTLSLICDEARHIVGGTGSAILLKEGDALRNAYGTGHPQPPIEYFPLQTTYYGELFQTGEVAVIRNAQEQIPQGQRSSEVRTLIIVPLIDGDKKIGLVLVSNKMTGFDKDDARILEMFAAQVVLALRNIRFVEQGEKLAVVGERQRLARELHDSVTQALYAANLCAEAASRSLDSEKYAGAKDQLQALRGMTQQAMRDMRSLIFDLHPPELESEGLVGAIQSRLNSVEGRSGQNPELRVEGDEVRLPLSTEEELFRIAIEALNNSAKHSRSDHVEVILRFSTETVTLTVRDNGKGFEADSLPSGGMGLRGMRERTERIAGELSIESSANDGTCIQVHAPIDG